ncbi:MAG: 3-dehydroquinate synthase [Lachnospiraceae bacterium]|nr:3-dehydroquinate synthase [Lachnospiraceae bacterium]
MKRSVLVDTSSGKYEVLIDKDINIGQELNKIHKACHILVVSDDTVFDLYGKRTVDSLKEAGYKVDTFVFEHGEKSKNLATVEKIVEYAGSVSLTRSDLMLALGGGVVGDITGFCSAIFLRGIDFVQVPTTVLAAVDSSVGGKTAVDLVAGKNLAGAFHQPIAVYLDTTVFESLPKATFAEGLAEAIKYGMIMDPDLYKIFRDEELDMDIVCEKCIADKAKIVHEDEFDTGIRKILNFGHTPGHAMEKLSNLSISHGEAVARGMVIMTRASEKKGYIPEGSTKEFIEILKKYNLPITCDFSAEDLANAGSVDKKRLSDTLGLIMLKKIGEAYIEDINIKDLASYYEMGLNEN